MITIIKIIVKEYFQEKKAAITILMFLLLFIGIAVGYSLAELDVNELSFNEDFKAPTIQSVH